MAADSGVADTKLVIVRGSTRPWHLPIFDENDAAEDLAAVDRASFVIKEHLGASTNVLLRSTQDGVPSLVVNSSSSRLEAAITQAEADALPLGTYVGQANLRFGDDDSWQQTDPITVEIIAGSAPQV